MGLAEALELVARLSRTKNYPRDEVGIVQLAEGLMMAAQLTGAPAWAIVKECGLTSEWCPSDAELVKMGYYVKQEGLK